METLVLIVGCAAAALLSLQLQFTCKRSQSGQYRSGDVATGAANLTIFPLQLVTPYSMGFCSDGTWDVFSGCKRIGLGRYK